jgi:hypothetical protein
MTQQRKDSVMEGRGEQRKEARSVVKCAYSGKSLKDLKEDLCAPEIADDVATTTHPAVAK